MESGAKFYANIICSSGAKFRAVLFAKKFALFCTIAKFSAHFLYVVTNQKAVYIFLFQHRANFFSSPVYEKCMIGWAIGFLTSTASRCKKVQKTIQRDARQSLHPAE